MCIPNRTMFCHRCLNCGHGAFDRINGTEHPGLLVAVLECRSCRLQWALTVNVSRINKDRSSLRKKVAA